MEKVNHTLQSEGKFARAYNNVTYTKQSSNHINNINNSFTRKPKRDNPVFIKKINSGIAGYKFNKFTWKII